MRGVLLVFGGLLFGCRQTPRTDDATEVRDQQSPATQSDLLSVAKLKPKVLPHGSADGATSVDDKENPEPQELWEASVDLDGDGVVEKIRLVSSDIRTQGSERADEEAAIPIRGCENDAPSCTAVLRVGSTEKQLELTPGYFGGIDLSTIDIDTKDGQRELLYRRRAEGHEDPPFIFTIGIFDGQQLHWQELDQGFGYDAGELQVPGNGLLTTEYDECSEVMTTTYRLAKSGLQKLNTKTRKGRDPSQCAACPYVYLAVEDDFVRQGEILRNLRSLSLNGQQSLQLDLSEAARVNGLVHVQLREEKPETTYLDSIWLEADGIDYAPVACGRRAYCTTNGRFHPIAEGQHLDLYFSVPPDIEQARLEAVGHYVPRDD